MIEQAHSILPIDHVDDGNLEKRVVEERAKHNTRVAKLRQAWYLVKEAAAI